MSNEVSIVSKWVGLVASLLVWLLGLIHVIRLKSRINWPENQITDDVQRYSWRLVFTFVPDILSK